MGAVLLAITIWWFSSAKNWFKGPKTTIDLPEGVSSADEIAAEHAGQDLHVHRDGDADPVRLRRVRTALTARRGGSSALPPLSRVPGSAA